MALKFLSNHAGTGNKDSVKLFQIRLDRDYVVFRGGEDEAGSAQLSGQLALCLTEPLTITHITLTFDGIARISYLTNSGSTVSGRRVVSKERGFYQKTWTFRDPGRGRDEKMIPDNYVWDFNLVLDGTMPESVEGLQDAGVLYRLKAEIGRKRAKDIVTRKPVRIMRTLGPSALELSHAMSVENIWPNKIEYSISTPSKAVVFGSFMQVHFKLMPLLKGLVIAEISTQLKEEHEFVVDPEWAVVALNGGVMKEDRVIVTDSYTIKPDTETTVLDESAEGFEFSRFLELPKSLSKCVQDCNVKGIKVRHKLKFNVQLHNPDGHISELRANLPVALYISESLPLDENNDVVDQRPQATRAAIQNDIDHAAPPVYEQHQFDQLYSDLDVAGYRSPGAALSSNVTPHSLSRRASHENISSLVAVAHDPNSVSASALSRRLADLRTSDRPAVSGMTGSECQPSRGDLSRGDPYGRVDNDDPSPGTSLPSSAGPQTHVGVVGVAGAHEAARMSPMEEGRMYTSGSTTPFFHTDHFEDLAKVPSYTTAVRTPAPRSGDSLDLPSYGAIVAQAQTELASVPPPPSAHLRQPHAMSGRSSSHTSLTQAVRRPMFGARSSHHSVQSDDERMLRVRQMRHGH